MENIAWEKSSERCIVQIITSPNWKEGIPLDPTIPKWLVKIKDLHLKDEYCPTDQELLNFIPNTMDKESMKIIAEAFEIKEKHNKANLVNPEIRKKEKIFRRLAYEIPPYYEDDHLLIPRRIKEKEK